MPWLSDLIGKSPFGIITEHSKKVYACVELIRSAAEALVNEDHDRIMQVQHEVSRLEYEADQIKDEIRKLLYRRLFISVSRDAMLRFLSAEDDVADRAQDFAVVLTLRKTKLHPELKDEFMNFVNAVIECAESLLAAAEELKALSETSFAGKEAEKTLEAVKVLGEKEWNTDKLQRRFARHFYSLEEQLDPITVLMYDKYCRKLGQVANAAETAGKYLRAMIEQT
jgi:predicted phosphate transport protein (TIGR00153 family)